MRDYPPPAFYFKVRIEGAGDGTDGSFQEVSGIRAEMELEPFREGGENRFVHQLPTGMTHPNLVLKRGTTSLDSPLATWCGTVLEGGLVEPVGTRSVLVLLLDEEGAPLRSWSFADAFPVRWEVDGFHSTKNEVAIETIELTYSHATRMS